MFAAIPPLAVGALIVALWCAAYVAIVYAMRRYDAAKAERDPLTPKQRVLIMTREGHAITGVLVSRGADWVVLHDATVIPQGSNPALAAKAGIVHLERTEVQWTQVLT